MQTHCNDALIVVDVQNDFVSGSMAIPGAAAIVAPINHAASILPGLVVATDWHPEGHVSFASRHPGTGPGDAVSLPCGLQRVFADHCVQGSWGAELAPGLQLGHAQLVLRKGFRRDVDSYGCFIENDATTRTGLAEYLRARGVQRVFLAGLARFGCVTASALGAAQEGFATVLIEDATAGRPGPGDEDCRRQLHAAGVTWVASTALLAKG